MRLKNKPIIVIDDFKTPNKNFGFDTYGHPLDIEYIKRTDVIYYSDIPASGNQGTGIVFVDMYQQELEHFLKDIPVFFEKI